MEFSEIKPGMEVSIQKEITEADTALNFGSGALNTMLATPTLSALMIEASVKAIDPLLPDGYISIGKMLEINHINSSLQGMTVTVTAKIKSIEINKVNLDISAVDELGQIGTGKHTRYIVKFDRIMAKAEERCKGIENLDR
jgi:predicted thioesterase